jgi:hypothetical protein
MITAPASPINLSVDPDAGRAVEATISPEGGKLEALGADGTHYLLDLPAGSVGMDTLIRMTPVKTVSGLPLKESTTAWAVQLEPEGLQLLANVTLTIQLPTPPPINQQIPFQYREDGKAFNLAAPIVNAAVDTGMDEKGIQLDIPHFSGYGMAIGYLGELEPVRQRLGGSVEERLSAEIARTLAGERQKMLLGSTDQGVVVLDSETLKQLLDQYFNQVIPERIEAAKTDCASGRLVLQTYLSMKRQMELLGTAGLDSGEPFPLPPGFTELVTRQCMHEEYEMCVMQNVIHRMIPMALLLLRQQAVLGVEEPQLDPETEQLIKKCLSFQLIFNSTVKEIQSGEIQFNSTTSVQAMVPIEWKLESTGSFSSMVISGGGPLTVMQYLPEILPSGFCIITSKESKDGGFSVDDLRIEYSEELDKDGIPRMKGLVMDYSLGGVQLTWSDQCIQHGIVYWAFTGMRDDYDKAYGYVHRAESFPLVNAPAIPNTFRATNWTTCNCGTTGEKEWQMTGGDTSSATPTLYEEKGSFKLLHRPK